MIPASYSVIRYIADPARNEPVNVGIVLWSPVGLQLTIDQSAVDRVIRDNPRLHRDALLGLEGMLRSQLGVDETHAPADLDRRVNQLPGFPVALTETRYTSLASEEVGAIANEVDRLVERIVRPRRRFGAAPESLAESLERQLRPLIAAQRVFRNHVFERTTTGVPRRIDFFANSHTNVGVDLLRLNLKRADEIRLRADAEANKVRDIADENEIGLLVFLDVSTSDDVAEATRHARLILDATPAEVTDDVSEVLDRLNADRLLTREEPLRLH